MKNILVLILLFCNITISLAKYDRDRLENYIRSITSDDFQESLSFDEQRKISKSIWEYFRIAILNMLSRRIDKSQIIADYKVPVKKIVISLDNNYILGDTGLGSAYLANKVDKSYQVKVHHKAPISALSFSADSKRFVSADTSGKLYVWDIAEDEIIAEFIELKSPITHAVLNKRGDFVLAACKEPEGHAIWFWEIDESTGLKLKSYNKWHFPVAFNDNDMPVIAGNVIGDTARYEYWLMDTESTKRILNELHCSADNLTIVSNSNGCYAAVASQASGVFILDIATGKVIRRIKFLGEEALPLAIDYYGKYVILNSTQFNTAYVCDVHSLRIIPLVGHEKKITCAAISKDGSSVVTGSQDGATRFWDLQPHLTFKQLVLLCKMHLENVKTTQAINGFLQNPSFERIFESLTLEQKKSIREHGATNRCKMGKLLKIKTLF